MTEESLFAAALERQNPTERKSFLDEACGSDAELRQRLEGLLQCHEQCKHFLEKPAVQQLAAGGSDDTPGGSTQPEPVPSDHNSVLRLLDPTQRPGALGRLKHFEVLEVLGKGGFGTVLKVFDDRLHRVAAIKVLAPELAANGTARLRFLREARATAAVRHENVIGIYGVDEEPQPFLVMDYIEGQTLQHKLDRQGPLPVKEILRIGVQVAEGLAAAHKQGLIHRDVKPANILLENSVERVKLSDFGLARAVDDASLTQSGLIAGTPQYMSPEQAEGHPVDQRSDLFSLGSVLYTMCTGRPPFRADSSLAVLRRVCESTPRPIRDSNPEVPEWLAGIIGKLHAKQPAERIQSARELADLLAARLAELQLGRPAVAGPGETRTRADLETRRPRPISLSGRVLVGLVAAPVLCALAVWLVLARPWQGAGNSGHLDPKPAAGQAAEPPPPGGVGGQPTPAQPVRYNPGPVRKVPGRAELAALASPADALKREQIAPLLLQSLFREPNQEPPGLVAVLGDDRFLLPRGDGYVMRIDQSADGKLLAVPRGSEVLVFETPSGKLQRTLPGPGGQVRRVAFSPDGRLLAAVTLEGEDNPQSSVRVWDLANDWQVLDRLQPPTVSLGNSCLVFTCDSKYLLTSGAPGKPLYVADARTGAKVKEIGWGPEFLPFLSVSGKLLAVADWYSNQVALWNTETWQEVKTFERTASWIGDVALSPNGKLLALGSAADIKLCVVETGETLHTLKTAGHQVTFHPDGKILLSGATLGVQVSHTVNRWDVQSGAMLGQYSVTGPQDYFFPRLSVDGTVLYLAYQHSHFPYVKVINAATGQEQPRLGHTGQVYAVAISPNGQWLASAAADHAVRLWDLGTGRLRHTLSGHGDMALTVAFSPDGKLLASGSTDRTVRLWDVSTGKELHTLTGLTGEVRQVVFAPARRHEEADAGTPAAAPLLAAGGRDGAVRLWDVRAAPSGGPIKLLHRLAGGGICWGIDFSPDGKTLAVGSEEGAIRLWDVGSGRPVAQWLGHNSRARSVAFHPDGRTLASTGDDPDSTVRLWDLTTLTQKECLETQEGPVLSGVWRADGAMLVSCGSQDGVVRLWDMSVNPPRGQVLPGLQVGKYLHAVALTPEGRYLATANPDGAIYLIRLAERGVLFPK